VGAPTEYSVNIAIHIFLTWRPAPTSGLRHNRKHVEQSLKRRIKRIEE
jgi:hypothetical protein